MTLQLMLFLLGLIGLVLSIYMTSVFVRVQRGEEVKCIDGACPMVMKTSYARTLGFPNSYLAIPYYGALATFGGLRLAGELEWMLLPVTVAAAAAAAMSAYLAYALLAKLKRN